MSFSVLWSKKRRAVKQLRKFQIIEDNCRRVIIGQELLVDTETRYREAVGKFWPPLLPRPKRAPKNAYERMFCRGTKENDLFRIVSTVACCELVGLFFYITIAIKYSTFPSRLGSTIGVLVQIIMGVMLAFPILRAVILLAVPSLATGQLRGVLLLFIISWAFQSPAMNTTKNLQGVAEAVACVRERIVDTANEFIDEANQQANKFSIGAVKSQAGYFLQGLDKVRLLLKNLQGSVLKYARQVKLYLREIVTVKGQCQRFFIGPYYFCLKIFNDVSRFIEDHSFYNSALLIKPLSQLKKTCGVARFGERVCVLPSSIKESLKEGFLSFIKDKVKAVMHNMLLSFDYKFWMHEAGSAGENWKEMRITMEHWIEANKSSSYNVEQLKYELKKQLMGYEMFLKTVQTVLTILIVPLLILPFIQAGIFAYSYTHHEKIANVYITEDFRKIDLLRETQGQPTLLPLLPKERKTYIDGHTVHMTNSEKSMVVSVVAMTVIGGLVPLILVALDIFTYNMVYHSYEFFRSNATRTDKVDHYQMEVTGEGFAANLLRRVLKIFSPLTSGKNEDDWRRCFVEPNPPDYALFQIMAFFYAICILLCFLEPYVQRLTVSIAEHYWPHRSRPRALYLYSVILEGRKATLSQVLEATKAKELKEQLAEDEALGRAHIINRGLPIMTSDQYQCGRCGRPDLSLSDARNAMICPNCNDLYCTDCYSVSRKCLSCSASLQVLMKGLELYYDSSCEEDDEAEGGGTANTREGETTEANEGEQDKLLQPPTVS